MNLILLLQSSVAEKRRSERASRLVAAQADVQAKLAAVDLAFDNKEANVQESFRKLNQQVII